jgi:hypothetical protein
MNSEPIVVAVHIAVANKSTAIETVTTRNRRAARRTG